MYCIEMYPWTKQSVFVEKDPQRKQKQKDIVTQKGGYHKGGKQQRVKCKDEKINYKAYKESHGFRKYY